MPSLKFLFVPVILVSVVVSGVCLSVLTGDFDESGWVLDQEMERIEFPGGIIVVYKRQQHPRSESYIVVKIYPNIECESDLSAYVESRTKATNELLDLIDPNETLAVTLTFNAPLEPIDFKNLCQDYLEKPNLYAILLRNETSGTIHAAICDSPSPLDAGFAKDITYLKKDYGLVGIIASEGLVKAGMVGTLQFDPRVLLVDPVEDLTMRKLVKEYLFTGSHAGAEIEETLFSSKIWNYYWKQKYELWQTAWGETKQETFFSTAETYWVQAGESDEGTSENSPAGNITYILDTYNLTNSIVKVKPGTHNAQIERFPLTLSDMSVTLEATGSPWDTIIYGPRGVEEDYPLIKVAADEITIRRFTIENYGIAILVTSSRNTIQGNHIANNKWGIGLVGSSNTVRDNTITNTTEIGVGIEGSSNMITKNTITASNNGVSISGSNNTVKDNTITNNKRGVGVGGSSNMIIGNTITENVRTGVDITGSNHIVKGNTINSNNVGVSIDHSENNLVKDNNISNNGGYGILLEDTSDNTIEGNIIIDNRKKSIKLSLNVDNTTIRNNIIMYNGLMGNVFILLEGLPTLALATLSVGIAFLTAFIAFYFFKKKRGA